jgi:tetratricopeptide (TPR) repeat protein
MNRVRQPRYSEKNIRAWQNAFQFAEPLDRKRIKSGDLATGWNLYSLSRLHENMGLTRIAQGEFEKALGHFGAAAEAWAVLLELKRAGEEVDKDLVKDAALGPQLNANASQQIEVLARYTVALEQWAEERPLEPLSRGMVEIATGKLDQAIRALKQPHGLDTEDLPWVSAPLAIAQQSEGAFREAMTGFSAIWKKRIRSEQLGKFPDAVCDRLQIGWICLWSRIWGAHPDVDLEAAGSPLQIFDVEPEPIRLGI